MKAFTSAAVLGLVPVPPMPATASGSALERCSDRDVVPDSADIPTHRHLRILTVGLPPKGWQRRTGWHASAMNST